jgi:hypothetical protein
MEGLGVELEIIGVLVLEANAESKIAVNSLPTCPMYVVDIGILEQI